MGIIQNPKVQRLAGHRVQSLFLGTVSKVQTFFLGKHKDPAVVRLIKKTRRERSSLQTAYEQFTVYSFAKAYAGRPGDFAEIGVYQGASAKLICEAKGAEKTLHLFDTFTGLPTSAEQDRGVHFEGEFACSLESVQGYLQGYPGVHYWPGLFPKSAEGAVPDDRKFAFVHCDVDLYESTLACLNYFYPRLIPGGAFLSHDYSILAGVKQAFADFCKNTPEPVAELPSTQCVLIKSGGC